MSLILEHILSWKEIKPGDSLTYEFYPPENVCYLGFLGEMAIENRCSKITLPMLSIDDFKYPVKLLSAISILAMMKKQVHVKSLNDAILDFSREMYNFGFIDEQPAFCLGNTNPYSKLHDSNTSYIKLDLGPKIVALTPSPDILGRLLINEDYFNFIISMNKFLVYRINEC